MKSLNAEPTNSYMGYFFRVFFCFFIGLGTLTAQDLEKTWEIKLTDHQGDQFPIHITDTLSFNDFTYLEFKKGAFLFSDKGSSSGPNGNYIYQNNVLVLYYDEPKDLVQHYKIIKLTDSTLVVLHNGLSASLNATKLQEAKDITNKASINTIEKNTIVPSQGFTISSLWRGALGMLVLVLIAFILSKNRKAINWRTVGFGLLAQLILAIGVLKVPFVQAAFEWVGGLFIAILDFTMAGTKFLFAAFSTNEIADSLTTFAISILPTIIFFSALTSVLFYLGIIQKVVKAMAWMLTKLLRISGAESLSVAGNIFLGQTESPLMIKAYLEKMTKSEILLVMIGGMATVAGGVLAAYIGFLGGEDEALRLFYAKHLLTASVMAAPGAIVVSKMLYPQQKEINAEIRITQDKIGSNILDAIANGTTEGLKLAVNVGAMLLVFLAFIAMINGILFWAGDITNLNIWIANNTPYSEFSLEFVLGYTFAPLMWLIGVAKEDIALMGQLLGVKLAASEFVGYIQLSELKNPAELLHLKYQKSIIMATYMLCGFANFASIGIQIGGIGSLAPGQRKTLSEFGLRALIGGTLASLLSATIAGMIIG